MNLRFDEAVEGPAQRPPDLALPRLGIGLEARDETGQSEPVVAERAVPSDEPIDQRRQHWLEYGQRAGAVQGILLLAAAEGKAASLGHLLAENEEAGAEARRGTIRVRQGFQGAVLRPVGVGDTGGVIGAAEHAALPAQGVPFLWRANAPRRQARTNPPTCRCHSPAYTPPRARSSA